MKTFLLFFFSALMVGPAFAQKSIPQPGLKPIRVIQSVTHQFPSHLARQYPKGGTARLLVTVRNDGELAEWLVTGYSALPFKDEAIAALKELTFEPANLRGEPIAARTELFLNFESRGMMVSTTAMENFDALSRSMVDISDAYKRVRFAELDRVPAVLHTVKPIYPTDVAERGIAGSVTVDFYIDEQGIVRMPSVIAAEPMILSEAAVQAIRQWKFEPPTRHGKPVLAQATQVFNFNRANDAAR